jgi:hypothetical protein
MQHIGNVNNVMNIDDGYLCSGARDVYAVNRRDPSKSSLGEMQPGSFADYDERIPAVDSLDDILGRSEESDDASNSFQPARIKALHTDRSKNPTMPISLPGELLL